MTLQDRSRWSHVSMPFTCMVKHELVVPASGACTAVSRQACGHVAWLVERHLLLSCPPVKSDVPLCICRSG